MENSGIQWTDDTFNPWIGCTKVSPGCKNCYAEADQDKRRGRAKWGLNGTRSVTGLDNWRKPIIWNKQAELSGKPRRVFCSSLADVFEKYDDQVVDAKGQLLFYPFEKLLGPVDPAHPIDNFHLYTQEWIDKHWNGENQMLPLTLDIIRSRLFKMIEETPYLTWQILTKRPENILEMVPIEWGKNGWPDNVWIGTSVENQEAATERIPKLLHVPAKIKFISCEPLLGPVDLTDLSYGGSSLNALTGGDDYLGMIVTTDCINWVIVGGESGVNARPMHPEWAYQIIADCERYKTSAFFKQHGNWVPFSFDTYGMKYTETGYFTPDHKFILNEGGVGFVSPDCLQMINVGKKEAGNKLDGVEVMQFPVSRNVFDKARIQKQIDVLNKQYYPGHRHYERTLELYLQKLKQMDTNGLDSIVIP